MSAEFEGFLQLKLQGVSEHEIFLCVLVQCAIKISTCIHKQLKFLFLKTLYTRNQNDSTFLKKLGLAHMLIFNLSML